MDLYGATRNTMSADMRDRYVAPLFHASCISMEAAVQHAYYTPYALTAHETQILTDMLGHRYIFSEHKRVSPHPIYATLLYIDTKECYDYASSILDCRGKIAPFIDVGGAISRITRTNKDADVVHGCYMVETMRDAHRVNEQAISLAQQTDAKTRDVAQQIFNHLHNNISMTNNQFCGGCSQKCTRKAHMAVAIHSIYDMTCHDVYDTFQTHSLNTMLATLLIPKELFYDQAKDARKYAKQDPFYITRVTGEYTHMIFTDGTTGYMHKTVEWKKWAQLSAIYGPDFTISIQVTRHYGPDYMLKLCRVPNTVTHCLPRLYPADYMSDYVAVPNLFHYVSLKEKQNKLPTIIAPRDFYNRLSDYILKLETVSVSNVYMFASSIKSRIDIASYTVNHAWLADVETSNVAIYSIIFMALARRRVDRDMTLDVFPIIDEQASHNKISVRERLELLFVRFRRWIWNDDGYLDPHEDAWCIKNMKVHYFEDLQFDIHAKLDRGARCSFVRSPFHPHNDGDCDEDDQLIDDEPAETEDVQPSAPPAEHVDTIYRYISDTGKLIKYSRIHPSQLKASGTASPGHLYRYTNEDGTVDVMSMTPPDQLKASPPTEYCTPITVSKVFYHYVTDQGKTIKYSTTHPSELQYESSQGSNIIYRYISEDGSISVTSKVSPDQLKVGSPTRYSIPIVVNQVSQAETTVVYRYVDDKGRELSRSKLSPEQMFVNPVNGRYAITDDNGNITAYTRRPPNFSSAMGTIKEESETDIIIRETMDELLDKVCLNDDTIELLADSTNPVGATMSLMIDQIVATQDEHCVIPDTQVIPDVVADNHGAVYSRRQKYRYWKNGSQRKITVLKMQPKINFIGADEKYTAAIQHLPSYRINNKCYAKMQDILFSFNIKIEGKVHDFGCGPGGWSSLFKDVQYTGVQHPATPVDDKHLQNYTEIIDVYDYKFTTCDLFISDVGPNEQNQIVMPQIMQHLGKFGTLIVKIFTDNINERLIDFITRLTMRYRMCAVYKPMYSGELNYEAYIIATNRHDGPADGEMVQDLINDVWCYYHKSVQANRECFDHIPADVYMPATEVICTDTVISFDSEDIRNAKRYYLQLFDVGGEEVNSTIASTIRSLDEEPEVISVNVITGAAGCAKSDFCAKNFNARESMIIVPTKALKEEFRRDERFAGWQVHTPHSAFKSTRKNIVLDECFTQPTAYIALLYKAIEYDRIYLSGSKHQIGPIDILHTTKKKYLHDVLDDINLNSKRMPQDALRLVTGIHDNKSLTTSSTVSRSIVAYDCDYNMANKIIDLLKYPIITYNRGSKENNVRRNRDAATVHDYQGHALERVILHIDHAAETHEFATQLQHVAVAMSRHTHTLVLVGRVTPFMRDLYYENTAFERNDAQFNQALVPFHNIKPTIERPIIYAHEEQVAFPNVNTETAITLLSDIIAVKTQDDNEAGLQFTDCTVPTGRLKIKLSRFLASFRSEIKGKHIPGAYRFTRRYTPGTFGEVKCIMSRYALLTKNGDDLTSTVDLIEGLASWTDSENFAESYVIPKHDVVTPFFTSVIAALSPNALGFMARIQNTVQNLIGGDSIDSLRTWFIAEYSKTLQAKGAPVSEDKDRPDEHFCRFISFFVKKQVKPDVRHYADERDKAHQGISAWAKFQNFFFCSYTRLFTKIFQSILKDNVIFASNESDATIAARAANLIADAEDSKKIFRAFACDFEQFDSKVIRAGPLMNAFLMFHMCAPTWLCLDYIEQRSFWILKTDIMAYAGNSKMHSGEPWTLTGNTIYNMAVIAIVYKFDDIVLAVFKGDDSGVLAAHIQHRNEAFAREHGIKLTVDTTSHLEFTGIIYNRYGGMPDILRRATKFLTTVWAPGDYELAVINLKAELAIIHDNLSLNAGCHHLATYYNEVAKTDHVSAESIRLLTGYLYHQSFKTYEQLEDFQKPILKFCAGELMG
nr:MAG: nonstructural polyprotein [Hangzhou hepe-like virus 1]